MIIAIFAGVTLLTIIRVLMETPLYTAQSTILIKPGTPQIFGTQVLGGDNSESGDQSDFYENYNKTQYEILKSRSLAVSAIKDDGLEKMLTSGGEKSGPDGSVRRGRQSRISSRGFSVGRRAKNLCPCLTPRGSRGRCQRSSNRRVHERFIDQAGNGYQPGQYRVHYARRRAVGAAGQRSRARLHPAGNRTAQPGK